jgi:beta-glucosidase/6-phospho-beta-glucosidase/beta-galactosidase
VQTVSGRARIRFPYGSAETVERVATDYWERYGRPLLIGETAGRGRAARRLAWLSESVEGVRRLRAQGIPLIGYTWWPMYDLVAWAYQHSHAPLGRFVVPMGLWGLDPDTLDRRPTALVDAYRALARAGAEAAGPLAPASLSQQPSFERP